jgi:hypothetical protein
MAALGQHHGFAALQHTRVAFGNNLETFQEPL